MFALHFQTNQLRADADDILLVTMLLRFNKLYQSIQMSIIKHHENNNQLITSSFKSEVYFSVALATLVLHEYNEQRFSSKNVDIQ